MWAGRGNPAELPGAGGTVGLLSHRGEVTDGARAGGAAPAPGPERAGPGCPPGGLFCAGVNLVLAWRDSPGPGLSRTGDYALRPLTAPLPCLPCRAGSLGDVYLLYGLGPVAAGLSGA